MKKLIGTAQQFDALVRAITKVRNLVPRGEKEQIEEWQALLRFVKTATPDSVEVSS